MAMYSFFKKLQFVKYQLKRWNTQCFGNILHAKTVAQASLYAITQGIREHGIFDETLKEELRALKAMEECELWEEIYWK